MKQVPVAATYPQLLKQIQEQIAQGLKRAQRAFAQEKVISYWKIGQAINNHMAKNQSSADYGKQLYSNLSRDLGLGERLLYQISQFYNAYPNFTPSQNINWTHYRILASVKNDEQRNALEAKVTEGNLSQRALDTFIKEDREKSVQLPVSQTTKIKKLSLLRGKLYAYSLFKGVYADNLLIDCGFNVYHESETTKLGNGFIESVKTADSYSLTSSNITRKHLYTYKAYIQKIVDADTLWVIVDCGFKIWIHQKLRLRGINAPGITTAQGLAAYKFVCSELKDLPFIIIKTHGRDKYDRYLADIVYMKDEPDPVAVLEKGEYLNQKLLDSKLAVYEAT